MTLNPSANPWKWLSWQWENASAILMSTPGMCWTQTSMLWWTVSRVKPIQSWSCCGKNKRQWCGWLLHYHTVKEHTWRWVGCPRKPGPWWQIMQIWAVAGSEVAVWGACEKVIKSSHVDLLGPWQGKVKSSSEAQTDCLAWLNCSSSKSKVSAPVRHKYIL